MTTTQLKTDIDTAVEFVGKLDKSLPGAAKLDTLLARIQKVAEKPLALTLLAGILTHEGF